MHKPLIASAQQLLQQLHYTLAQLTPQQYALPLHVLSNASVGAHARHIADFFAVLLKGYNTGLVDYDARERDLSLETNLHYMLQVLTDMIQQLKLDDKQLLLATTVTGSKEVRLEIATTYTRELLYNMEHTIHHMALLRIGIHALGNIVLPQEFGIAASTIKYRKAQCA